VQGFFSHPSDYRIQLATGVQPIIREATDGSASMRGLTPPRSVTDSKSVFVGNLPEGTTKNELTQLFQRCGTVVDANVVHKAYPGNSINVFGFVEFVNFAEAEAASMQEQYLGDHKLRIEPKEYSARRASRLNAAPMATPVRTPRRISPSASRALAMRLVRNEVDNTYPANSAPIEYAPPTPAYKFHTEEWQTPHHYLPAHLFSPSPPGQPPMYYGPPGFGGEAYYHGPY
jgi:RNA recognition motif-containing protein